MPDRNDRELEMYLRKFRPVAPQPLPIVASAGRRRRFVVIGAWASALAAAAALAIVMLHSPRDRVVSVSHSASTATPARAISQPLTLAAATRLLATSPSLEAVFDSFASETGKPAIPKNERSAFQVLSQGVPRP